MDSATLITYGPGRGPVLFRINYLIGAWITLPHCEGVNTRFAIHVDTRWRFRHRCSIRWVCFRYAHPGE